MKPNIELIKTSLPDLETLFLFQLDEESNYLAAFTPKDHGDKTAYLKKWSAIITNPAVNMRTITLNSVIVGSVSKYELDGRSEITYWIDRKMWGKGIATEALRMFLETERPRPIYGRVAFDNFGSQKVMEKCGFKKIATDEGFANARKKVISEFVYILE